MATFSISGNVSSATAAINNQIVYLQNVETAANPPAQITAQTDSNGNFTFSGLNPGTYQLFSAGKPTARQVIQIVANNITGIAFSA